MRFSESQSGKEGENAKKKKKSLEGYASGCGGGRALVVNKMWMGARQRDNGEASEGGGHPLFPLAWLSNSNQLERETQEATAS